MGRLDVGLKAKYRMNSVLGGIFSIVLCKVLSLSVDVLTKYVISLLCSMYRRVQTILVIVGSKQL